MLNVNLFFNSEGQEAQLPRSCLQQYLSQLESARLGESINGSFVWKITGIVVAGNILSVVFPKNYTLPESEEERKKAAAALLHCLMRYRAEKQLDELERDFLYGGKWSGNGQIVTACLLIEDYLASGSLKVNHTIRSHKLQGRIDWPNTVLRTCAMFDNGTPVYFEPVKVSRARDSDDLLKVIHLAVVDECLTVWGWMYDASTDEKQTMPCSDSEAIAFLENRLQSTFAQRELYVIKLLLSFLRSKEGAYKENKVEYLCTPYFYWVWEAICSDLFDNQYAKLKNLIPKPRWHSPYFRQTIEQIPDILFVNKEVLYIVDAKYYNYTKNAPGWADIVT